MNPIYMPREDSFLLENNVQKYVFGKVLDVGTGSGIQAVATLKKSKEVTAVDINPEAIRYCKEKYIKINFIESDLFSNVSGKFDFIIFNPPYLPNDSEIKDIALDGGKEGWELTARFLVSAKEYLSSEGKILLLISSLTKKDKVDSILKENNYKFEEVDSLKMDFEELFVYLIEND